MTEEKRGDKAGEEVIHAGSSIDDALPCPFCGEYPEVVPWHGGGPNKHRVGCINNSCHCAPATTGNTKKAAIARWNVRKK